MCATVTLCEPTFLLFPSNSSTDSQFTMDKSEMTHVEVANDVPLSEHTGNGQVKLMRDGEVVLIPTPTTDPRGIIS